MRLISSLLITACLGLAACSTRHPRTTSTGEEPDVFTDKLSNGKPVNRFRHSFDARDYDFIGAILEKTGQPAKVYYQAPYGPDPSAYGPNPSVDSTWAIATPFSSLRKKLLSLRQDTYRSFMERNAVIAEHAIPGFSTASGKKVRITRSRLDAAEFCRIGFSKDGRQALSYNGQSFALYERAGSSWNELAEYTVWAVCM